MKDWDILAQECETEFSEKLTGFRKTILKTMNECRNVTPSDKAGSLAIIVGYFIANGDIDGNEAIFAMKCGFDAQKQYNETGQSDDKQSNPYTE